jgi:two-component system, LuxR family, sensor kinase FixL
LARGLAPVRADAEGLREGFTELAQSISERFGIRVNLDLQMPREMFLTENTATNLYRIAQEGVLNAARHAEARNVLVEFLVEGLSAELVIQDDGRGFSPTQVEGPGMGLNVMRFRAQLLGGYFAVESKLGAGTTLRCRCPLPSAQVAA